MAITNVTSSGNLIFAVTGLGNPVPTFANEGIATGAISESPIGGNSSKIYNIGPPNYFTSSGGLSVVSVNLGTQSGLAASAIGEFPISGIVDNIPQVEVGLFFTSPGISSQGNLSISGNTVENCVWIRLSDGNLVETGTTVSDINLVALSSGNLLISGSTVARTLFNELSAGNLTVTANSTNIINMVESTSGVQIISGETIEIQAWNKQSAGNLVLTGNTVNIIGIGARSTGNLVVDNFGYSSLFTGGIAADPMASQAIAAGNIANVVTTQVSFYGNIISQGNLTVTPVGQFVEPLSDVSGIAGAALADQTIGGGKDSGVEVTQVSYISNGIYYDGQVTFVTSSGNLLISGSSEQNQAYNNNTSGNLLISGSTTSSRTINLPSNGNLLISGSTTSSRTINLPSSGNLLISGTTVSEFVPAGSIESAGSLVISGSATAEFIPAKPSVRPGGGGSYVFASSWDILTPYFPDDRHIFGYQQGETAPGNLRVRGFSTVTVISNTSPARKTLSGYIDALQNSAIHSNRLAVDASYNIKEKQNKNFVNMALAEDQLLLSGQLFDFDPIQDELHNELSI